MEQKLEQLIKKVARNNLKELLLRKRSISNFSVYFECRIDYKLLNQAFLQQQQLVKDNNNKNISIANT